MPSKIKDGADKVSVLKGQEAEDKVLEYMRKMNRPYGAVDVCANLKGAIPKASTQKILMALAEKGVITQKAYGKTVFFVANQAQLEEVPQEQIKLVEADFTSIEEENKILAAEARSLAAELAKLKGAPTDMELQAQIETTKESVEKHLSHLVPLRSGTPLVSAAEIAQLDTNWSNWRTEWINRRKIYNTFWYMVSDSMPPQEADSLAEDIGIERDTTEHFKLEQSTLCMAPLKKK